MNHSLIIVYPIIISFLISCNNKDSADEMNNLMIGQWSITVNQDGYNGVEIYNFTDSKDFSLKGNLHFEGEDSGFRFSMPLTISINGEWNIDSQNCLILKYFLDSLKIDTNLQLFEVSTSNGSADSAKLTIIKEEMGKTLQNFIQEDLKNTFELFKSSEIEVGKITKVSDNSILLEMNGGNMILNKI